MVDDAPLFEQQHRDTFSGVMNYGDSELNSVSVIRHGKKHKKKAAIAAFFDFRSDSA